MTEEIGVRVPAEASTLTPVANNYVSVMTLAVLQNFHK
jgi:hypothetical protein